jgi:hypothetical protein
MVAENGGSRPEHFCHILPALENAEGRVLNKE